MKDILLVEDNRHILDGNRYFLEKAGDTCAAAETIAGAKEIIVEETPRLMILDLMLPDGNGLDLLAELRASSDPAFSGMPVLILTGLGSNPDVVRGLSAGGDDYLPKPYDYEVLLARVKALMRRSGMNRAERSGDIIERGALKLDILSSQAFLRGEDRHRRRSSSRCCCSLCAARGRYSRTNTSTRRCGNSRSRTTAARSGSRCRGSARSSTRVTGCLSRSSAARDTVWRYSEQLRLAIKSLGFMGFLLPKQPQITVSLEISADN